MVTTWTPSNTTEAKSPGTQLCEHVFGTPLSSDEAFVALEQGLSAGVLRKLKPAYLAWSLWCPRSWGSVPARWHGGAVKGV